MIRPFPSNGCVCIDALMAGMDVSHGSMRVMIDLLSVIIELLFLDFMASMNLGGCIHAC